jgi:hypothetical protein
LTVADRPRHSAKGTVRARRAGPVDPPLIPPESLEPRRAQLSQLETEAKALIRRLAGAAALFRMNRGTPVTLAQFVAFIVGADGDSNVPYDEALKLSAEMTALGNQREAGDKWLN